MKEGDKKKEKIRDAGGGRLEAKREKRRKKRRYKG